MVIVPVMVVRLVKPCMVVRLGFSFMRSVSAVCSFSKPFRVVSAPL